MQTNDLKLFLVFNIVVREVSFMLHLHILIYYFPLLKRGKELTISNNLL